VDLRFTKMHGLGNDFVVVDDLDRAWDIDPDAVRLLCDRHFGIGGDGLILVRPATVVGADFFMLYFNADGTTAEMCGNGIRCFAKWLVDRGHVKGDSVRVQTLGGIKPVDLERGSDGLMTLARVDMGEPVLHPPLIPATFPGEQVFECPLETPLGTFKVTAVSMGNPHAVIWVDDVDTAPVETLGPIIETDPHFPAKTNVEFAQVVEGETDRVRLRVWERGVGETLACGTGACATAVAAALSCRTGRTVTIELPGGELDISWAPDGHVYMAGTAEEVFTGAFAIIDEDEYEER
jgi:diaminopimelate epimerase